MKSILFSLIFTLALCPLRCVVAEEGAWRWLAVERIKVRQTMLDGEVVYRFSIVGAAAKPANGIFNRPEWEDWTKVTTSFSLTANELRAVSDSIKKSGINESLIGDRWLEKLYLVKKEAGWVIEWREARRSVKRQQQNPEPRLFIGFSDADLRLMLTVLEQKQTDDKPSVPSEK